MKKNRLGMVQFKKQDFKTSTQLINVRFQVRVPVAVNNSDLTFLLFLMKQKMTIFVKFIEMQLLLFATTKNSYSNRHFLKRRRIHKIAFEQI